MTKSSPEGKRKESGTKDQKLIVEVSGSGRLIEASATDRSLFATGDKNLRPMLDGILKQKDGKAQVAISFSGRSRIKTTKGGPMIESRTVINSPEFVRAQMELARHEPASNAQFLSYLSALRDKSERTKGSDLRKTYVSAVPFEGYVRVEGAAKKESATEERWYLSATWNDTDQRWDIQAVNDEFLHLMESTNQRLMFVGVERKKRKN